MQKLEKTKKLLASLGVVPKEKTFVVMKMTTNRKMAYLVYIGEDGVDYVQSITTGHFNILKDTYKQETHRETAFNVYMHIN